MLLFRTREASKSRFLSKLIDSVDKCARYPDCDMSQDLDVFISFKMYDEKSPRHTSYKRQEYLISRNEFIGWLTDCSNTKEEVLNKLTTMTEKEELFKKFFSLAYSKAISIDAMSLPDIEAWIDELEVIAFEARATSQGADKARKERTANLANSEKEKLRLADSIVNSSSAINSVKKRADRMTKMDKTAEGMRALGVDEETIKAMTKAVKVDESYQKVTTRADVEGNKVTFNRRKEDETVEIVEVVESLINTEPKPITTDDLPFNPDDLFK